MIWSSFRTEPFSVVGCNDLHLLNLVLLGLDEGLIVVTTAKSRGYSWHLGLSSKTMGQNNRAAIGSESYFSQI